MYYFDPKTGGFLNDEIHSEIPDGCLEIQEETYEKLKGQVLTIGKDGYPALAVIDPGTVNPVPVSVSMMQARLAMLNAGILDKVESAISGMTGDEGKAAQIQWQYAAEVRRDWPLVVSLQSALKLTTQQVDDLFIAAAAI